MVNHYVWQNNWRALWKLINRMEDKVSICLVSEWDHTWLVCQSNNSPKKCKWESQCLRKSQCLTETKQTNKIPKQTNKQTSKHCVGFSTDKYSKVWTQYRCLYYPVIAVLTTVYISTVIVSPGVIAAIGTPLGVAYSHTVSNYKTISCICTYYCGV